MIQMGVYLMIGTIIYGSIISLIVAWMLHAKEKDKKVDTRTNTSY